MTDKACAIADALREHLAVCNDLLALAQRESEALQDPAPYPAGETRARRQELLRRLESSWAEFARVRGQWERLNPDGGEPSAGFAALSQTVLDTIMRVLVLDRENEQGLLRRGLLPPQSIPAAERERPGFVAGIYQRNART
jgi:hypothetical protein